MIRKVAIAFVLFLVAAGSATAQDECEIVLSRATEEFNAGHFQSIAELLKDCIAKNDNREWRQRAFLLLAETSLLLDDQSGAEATYLNVLRANPEFVTDEKRDPIDLVYLSRKFTADPIFEWRAFIGPNTSVVRVIHDVRPGGEPYSKEHYKLRMGWQIGGALAFNYNQFLSASVGFGLQQAPFRHETTDLFGVNKDIVDLIDRQTWISVPFSVRWSESKGKFRRYVYAGYAYNYLLADRADVEINNRDGQVVEELTSFEKSISNINLRPNRNARNSAVFLGVGVKYKYKLNYFYLDARYAFGLKNVADINQRFSSLPDGLPFPYVDDDFRIDNVLLSVGYIHPLYKPRKLRKARTKSVLRKIERDDRQR